MRPSRGASKRTKRLVSSEIEKAVKEVKYPLEWQRFTSNNFQHNFPTSAAIYYLAPDNSITQGVGVEGQMPGLKGVWRHITMRMIAAHKGTAVLPGALTEQLSFGIVCLIHVKSPQFDVASFFEPEGTLPERNPFGEPWYTLIKRWDVILMAPIVATEWVTVGDFQQMSGAHFAVGDGGAKLLVFDEDVELPFSIDETNVITDGSLAVVIFGDNYSFLNVTAQLKYVPAAF